MELNPQLSQGNAEYAAGFTHGGRPREPRLRVVVVTCMDARVDPARILGLELGDAHVLRNAGGVVTDDVLRSLAISQRRLGTREVVVMGHTGCGMLSFSDEEFAADLERETGERPGWRAGAFGDLEQSVRDGVRRVRTDPFIPHTDTVTGLVYDVETGRVHQVP